MVFSKLGDKIPRGRRSKYMLNGKTEHNWGSAVKGGKIHSCRSREGRRGMGGGRKGVQKEHTERKGGREKSMGRGKYATRTLDII